VGRASWKNAAHESGVDKRRMDTISIYAGKADVGFDQGGGEELFVGRTLDEVW
jgi:hypothetical protein